MAGQQDRISHDQAREAARRLIKGAFRRDGLVLPACDRPRFTIPCRPQDDDDCAINEYIRQQKEAETRAAKILAERNQLIGILQVAVEQNGDREKEPAWFVAACRFLNAGFTKAVVREAISDADDQLERIYSFGVLVRQAHAEAAKAMKRFPQPNYVISKIAEEAGEVVKAAIHCAEHRETAENVAKEMTQLIAMLIRLWVEGDQVHGLPPISETGNPNE
jgi:phosphoribosyl-ATP pyrophosphohydrolase